MMLFSDLSSPPDDSTADPRSSRVVLGLGLAAAASLVIVAFEVTLQILFNPGVAWDGVGLAAHAALDVALLLPIVACALWLGHRMGRRLGCRWTADEIAGRLGAVGLVALLFGVLALPATIVRVDLHEAFGNRWDLALAEVQTTVVRSDLTVQEATQLCSYAAVRDPGRARDGESAAGLASVRVLRDAGRDTLIQLAVLLPVFIGMLAWRRRDHVDWRRALGRIGHSIGTASRLAGGPVRLAGLGAAAFVLFCTVRESGPGTVHAALERPEETIYDACRDGGPVREYRVSAIDVTLTLNRYGDHVTDGHMYALDANIPAIREFETALAEDRALPDGPGIRRVAHGLRKDPIQPLVIRGNLGECLRIQFTHRLDDEQPASMHILGLPHRVESASSSVGFNPDTSAAAGQTMTYEIPLPLDVQAERAYYFHDHGAGRRRQNMGLFGAIVVEPEGATYLDVETGEPLDNETGSAWEAIIVDPNLADRADGKSFREFVIFYHEIGDEAFTDIRDRDGKKLPLIDEIAGVYRPAARALNYRSEPFRRRLEIEKTGKALGYASYPFGDPATPIPRSYLGEGVKTRLLHGGSEVFHVHHLHGGGDRWRRNPDTDPNNDFWKGLTKVPDPNLTSIHLDSQSIGPGTSYNLEHECGAGGCQQGAGDFLYHCHIGHHYISGMWSFWRVFDTLQTPETNLYSTPLAVIPELYQNPDNPLMPPEPPRAGVSAGELLGLVVDDGRTIVADEAVSDSAHQIGLMAWLRHQLPPQGERLDAFDATVWDWISTGVGSEMQVWGEPESDQYFAGYVSTTPGERPEVLFNAKNGRYAWPLFRPQKGQRPPFTARHSGAPWLGEEMREGRLDGLCAVNGVDPAVDVGPGATKRFYPLSSITMPLQISADRQDEDGMIFVLNEEEEAIRDGRKLAEPLTIRSNVGDCVELVFTNKIPDGPLNKDFSKTNIHSHFVQFDTQASDGVITGMSYEQSVRPIESEGRWLTSPTSPGDRTVQVNHTERLREGIWIGVGLGEGTCGTSDDGQPLPCTEIRQIAALDDTSITFDQPLRNAHATNDAVGVEFVRYLWYSDVDFGTVFFHTHVEFKDWDHGLFGTHIVEPKGSTYHDPTTGESIRAGSLADIRVDPSAGGNPVAWNVDGSFREFVLYLHDNNPAEGAFTRGGGTINLRAEPWRLREGDTAYRFSSVAHGDPLTPLVRAYVGDPVVVRGMGLVERVGGVRFTGHRFQQERYTEASDTRDTTFLGISERFDVSLEGGAGGVGGYPGDYLYYSTLGRDFESGAWGILRVHDAAEDDLQPLPDRPMPGAGDGFPQLAETGAAPPSLPGSGTPCPGDAPTRRYDVVIADQQIVYHGLSSPDAAGVVYHLQGQPSAQRSVPLVLRAAAGECLELGVRNVRSTRSSISLGELVFDPQRSYGAAIGYNHDSTIAAKSGRVYRYFADREVGLVLGANLGDVDSIERGAFAGVVVEPAGSTWFRPGKDEPLPANGFGIQADIEIDGVRHREMVALFNDQDRRIGQNAMPYPVLPEGQSGISYAREPLTLRDINGRPAKVFDSTLWGDPRQVVTVPAGTPLVYRVGHAWGNQMHVPALEGHRWYQEPGMPGSEQVYDDALAPGMTLDLWMVGGAGGDIAAEGDYLFLDRRQPFLEAGLWNILRVTADGTSGAADRVAVSFVIDRPNGPVVRGRNTIRPAGDFAPSVTVHLGAAVDGVCTGPVFGTTPVDPGNGAWRLQVPGAGLPDEVCATSTGGGIDTKAAGAPVAGALAAADLAAELELGG